MSLLENLAEGPKRSAILDLNVSEILRLCQTNKKMYQICQDDSLWKDLVKRDFRRYYDETSNLPGDKTWKSLFVNQYEYQRKFRKDYPFWFEHSHDAQLSDLFEGGWELAYERMENAPTSYKSKKLRVIYTLAHGLDPNVHFADAEGKPLKRPHVLLNTARRGHIVLMLFSPGISINAILGIISYMRAQGVSHIFAAPTKNGQILGEFSYYVGKCHPLTYM